MSPAQADNVAEIISREAAERRLFSCTEMGSVGGGGWGSWTPGAVGKQRSIAEEGKKLMMSGQQTKKLNVTDGRAKREGGMTEGRGIYETSAEGGGVVVGFQYFPSDSASTTNQTQTRNTNTHTVAHRLNCAISEPLKTFASSTTPRPPLTYGRTEGGSVVYHTHCRTGVFVLQQGFLQLGMQITNIWRHVHASTNSIFEMAPPVVKMCNIWETFAADSIVISAYFWAIWCIFLVFTCSVSWNVESLMTNILYHINC